MNSRQSFEFDSLVWRTNVLGAWRNRVVITEQAFQAGGPRDRWVSQLHSFDATNGTAIIKVAEESLPRPFAGGVRVDVVYSWREWNILTNGEIRLIRICADPFEKF